LNFAEAEPAVEPEVERQLNFSERPDKMAKRRGFYRSAAMPAG
jgi:hypothetical protein